MELIDYISRTDLNNKTEREKALYLCFYHYKESGVTEFSLRLISELFVQCGFSIPNSSRLKGNLTKGKEKTFSIIKKSSSLSIIPVILQELERSVGILWEDNINYSKFISSMSNEHCNDAILRIIPRIDLEEISSFIEGTPYISDLQKNFYQTYITARYEEILLPTYQQLIGEDIESDFSQVMSF